MALPTSYLTSFKNVRSIMEAIQDAEAPQKFNRKFLEDLGFKGSADRLIINVLKALGFLSPDGSPTDRYIRYLDQTEAPKVMAEGLRSAYADLFALKRDAQTLSRAELKSKIKSLRHGKGSDLVIGNMASTFIGFAKLADWAESAPEKSGDEEGEPAPLPSANDDGGGVSIAGLSYAIHLQLPESRDQAVYDALFKSLKSHLLG
jgi:Family of unknown function (DUF5343)